MATIVSEKFYAPKFMAGDGCGTNYVDKIDLSALGITALAVGDTLEFSLPAGAEVVGIDYDIDRLDTNGTPTLAFKCGYKSRALQDAQLVADDDAFGSGLTIGRTKARGSLQFKPMHFNEPATVFFTVTAVPATYAAGTLSLIVAANCVGVN